MFAAAQRTGQNVCLAMKRK